MSMYKKHTFSIEDRAVFETTKRLLAQAINDKLLIASIKSHSFSSDEKNLYIKPPPTATVNSHARITCALAVDAYVEVEGDGIIGALRPDYLQPPLLIIDKTTSQSLQELQPGPLCRLIASWQNDSQSWEDEAFNNLMCELQDSVNNQQQWLKMFQKADRPLLSLQSPLIDWETSILWGHPIHPLHRTCRPLPPMDHIQPINLTLLLEPAITFLSLPRDNVAISGPFEDVLQPLLTALDVKFPTTDINPNLIIVPCLATQLPAILAVYPSSQPLKTVHNQAKAHISLRTISPITPQCNFPFHLKFSLNYQITSTVRNLHPQTVLGSPQISSLLCSLLPENLWVFEHAACLTGAISPFPKHTPERAQYLSCILRRSVEGRAEDAGEALIPAAALYSCPLSSLVVANSSSGLKGHKPPTYAEVLFNLNTQQEKKSWFRKYTRTLFQLLLPPLVKYGIGLEAHAQNILLRVDKSSGGITGFAVRDFDGLRMHWDTLCTALNDSSSSVCDSNNNNNSRLMQLVAQAKQNLEASRNFVAQKKNVWDKVHHALIQLHISHLVCGLGLEGSGEDRRGWAIVREELASVLLGLTSGEVEREAGREVYEYFLREKMSVKCFLRMRFDRISGDHFDRELPNVLLRH